MNIKTLKEAFEIINIDMLYDEGIIREKKAGNEDCYGFQFSEKLWNIFSYQRGNKKILYSFDEKSKAVKHFMIFMINIYATLSDICFVSVYFLHRYESKIPRRIMDSKCGIIYYIEF